MCPRSQRGSKKGEVNPGEVTTTLSRHPPSMGVSSEELLVSSNIDLSNQGRPS